MPTLGQVAATAALLFTMLGSVGAGAASAAPPRVDRLAASATDTVTPQLATCTKEVVWVSGTGGPNSWRVRLPASGGGSWDCIMGIGNQSEAVLALQFSLNLCHGYNLAYDGIYGPKTADAVKDVQRLGDVPADGVYGPQTQAVIRWSWWHRQHGRTCGYLDV